MAAAGSMRETVRALTNTFSAPTPSCPLPDELFQTIDAFLERYHDIEDYDAHRFHEDLLTLYMRHVAGNPEKLAPFLSALRRLRPALTGEARLDEWWSLVIKPSLDMGHKRHEIEEARGFLQDVLAFDAETDKSGEQARLSRHFTKIILDAYLAKTKVPSSGGDIVSPEDEFVSHELETVLVAFGRRKPKELLIALDQVFVQKEHRIQALNLLSAFVRLQPPHLYLVLETPLISHLEMCLLIDTSSTVIELALLVLIMLLPHIAASLTSNHHLAKLFLIYSRILCWDKFGATGTNNSDNESSDEQDDETSKEYDGPDHYWQILHHSADYPDTAPPAVLHYFTFLYGLFPLNFLSFLRKPRKYLKSQNFPDADDFDLDQDLIHSRTEPHRRVHLLHPNTFTTTIEDELTDNRWFKADPADIVTECMDLCVAVSTTLDDPGPPPTSALPPIPVPPIPDEPSTTTHDEEGANGNDSAASWRNTQSTMIAPSTTGPSESSDPPPKPKSIKSSRSASPLLKAHDVSDSPTLPASKKPEQLLGASLLSPYQPDSAANRLGNFAQALTTASNSPTHSEFQNHGMAALQREIMLLRNDLNFERYLKQQHLAHIGQLQRKHIKEATDAAETQNLINANRTLKAKLAKANELYAQLKKETLTSRSQSKKWEGELSAKVRSYREDQRSWHSNQEELRFELKKSQQDCEHLKKMVEKAEAEQLKAQQRTRALEIELEDYGTARRELEALQEKVMMFHDQSKELDALVQERSQLRSDLEVANLRLNSREKERDRSIKAYERRIMELESRLQTTASAPPNSGQLPASVQQMLDSALAANNAKLQQLKKTHYRLLEQHTELQMKYHELEGDIQAGFRPQEKYNYTSPEKDALSRNFSFRQNTRSPNYDSKYLPPLTTDTPREEYEDFFNEYNSPVSVTSQPHQSPPGHATAPPPRPVRLESLHSKRSAPPTTNVGFGQDFSAAYDGSLNAHFQANNAAGGPGGPDAVTSSGKSTFSVDTSSSKGDGGNGKTAKDKVAPKSEVRVYGRGGAQNIGKKVKDKDEEGKKEKEKKDKDKDKRTGGFRGLKGIM